MRTLALALPLWLGITPALGTQEDPRLAAWVTGLASGDAEVRTRAGRELLASGPDGIRALLDAAAGPNLVAAEEARTLLTSAGPDAIDVIRQVGYEDPFDHRQRLEEAVAAVARMGQQVLPLMLETLETTDPETITYSFAVGVIRRLGTPAVEPMTRLLGGSRPRVRQTAATLLAYWGDHRAFDALLAALDDDDGVVRAYAARGLGKIADPRAADPLLLRLKDADWGARSAAVGALGRIYEPRFLEPLAAIARGDRQILVRAAASSVLMHYSGDPVAIRVGKRYSPYALSPARQPWIELVFALRFVVTGALLLGSVVWHSRSASSHGGVHWPSGLLLAAVAGGAGYYWGGVIEHIWAFVEYQLFSTVTFMVAVAGFLVGKVFTADPRRKALVWTSTATSVVFFYVGYGLGWLGLWGYLGT